LHYTVLPNGDGDKIKEHLLTKKYGPGMVNQQLTVEHDRGPMPKEQEWNRGRKQPCAVGFEAGVGEKSEWLPHEYALINGANDQSATSDL